MTTGQVSDLWKVRIFNQEGELIKIRQFTYQEDAMKLAEAVRFGYDLATEVYKPTGELHCQYEV
jgi:hypothetical protein